MYKCFICHSISPPRSPRLCHVIRRRVPHLGHAANGKPEATTRDEIAREIPVCRGCADDLRWHSLAEVIRRKRPRTDAQEAVAALVGALVEPLALKPPPARSFFTPRGMETVRPDGKAKAS